MFRNFRLIKHPQKKEKGPGTTFPINFWYTWKSCGFAARSLCFVWEVCIVSETLWSPCCPFRKGDWDSPGHPTAVSSRLHPLLKNSGLVQTCRLNNSLCPDGLVFRPGFLLLQLTWIFSLPLGLFFWPQEILRFRWALPGGERHAAFSNCSGCSISWACSHVHFAGMKRNSPLWTRRQSFHGVFLFSMPDFLPISLYHFEEWYGRWRKELSC